MCLFVVFSIVIMMVGRRFIPSASLYVVVFFLFVCVVLFSVYLFVYLFSWVLIIVIANCSWFLLM